jgi:hypothetical protein
MRKANMVLVLWFMNGRFSRFWLLLLLAIRERYGMNGTGTNALTPDSFLASAVVKSLQLQLVS